MPEFPLRLVVSQIVAAAAEELEGRGKKVRTALELLFCEPSDVKKACAFEIVHSLYMQWKVPLSDTCVNGQGRTRMPEVGPVVVSVYLRSVRRRGKIRSVDRE
ncbi:unnamed protein product [Sphagnum jensenii]|uniref:Uncharacterized protein n=1 Tax=Sphagnum jensenii TaxID=128206 RepID=A0ABP1BKL3_9BRYO